MPDWLDILTILIILIVVAVNVYFLVWLAGRVVRARGHRRAGAVNSFPADDPHQLGVGDAVGDLGLHVLQLGLRGRPLRGHHRGGEGKPPPCTIDRRKVGLHGICGRNGEDGAG
jgi:hypothetical protein